MEYLIRAVFKEEIFNFVFDEEKTKQFLHMMYPHMEHCKVIALYGNMREKRLYICYMEKHGGGYVEDEFENLVFNF